MTNDNKPKHNLDEIMRAKYCADNEGRPQIRVSALWKKITTLKGNIKDHIIWDITDFTLIQIVNQS
jgi:hypothetical protein